MVEQLDSILGATTAATTTVQVLPFSAGAHPAQSGNFMVLHFDDPSLDPSLAYFDGPINGYFISEAPDVASMCSIFQNLRAQAINETDSRNMIAAIRNEFRKRAEDHG